MNVVDTGPGTGFSCRISPADEIGIIENLLERIRNLETDVARLKSGTVQANQLSDISQQVGWVTGIEYMGTEGWTRTQAGTLIPPPGFSLSGNSLFQMYDFCTGETVPYQGVSVDENGVIQFGFKPNGQVCGEKVDEWNGVASPDYYRFALNDGGYNQTSSSGITAGVNSYSLSAGTYSGSVQFTVSQAGLYLVQHSACWIFSGGTAANTILGTTGILQAGTNAIPTKWFSKRNDIQWVKNLVGQIWQDQIGDLLYMNQSEVFMLDTTNNKITSQMLAFALPGANLPGDIRFSKVNVSVVRLGSAA